MSCKEFLKKINESLQPYYLFLTMVFFFVTSIVSISRSLSNNSSDVVVNVKYGSMNYPSSINSKYLSVLKEVAELSDSTKILNNANDVRRFLTQTRNVKYITIKNNRNRIISDVAFRDCSVTSLTAYGISSTFKLPEESSNYVNELNYNEKSNIVFFSNPITLYPHEEFKIALWGSFNTSVPFVREPIFVNYDDHAAKIVSTKEVSGFPALIAEYYGFFFVFVFLVFSVVFYYSITRKKNG